MPIRWKLREALKARGLTAYGAAKAADLHRQSLSALIRHPDAERVDCDTLAALCRVLKCQPGELLEYRK